MRESGGRSRSTRHVVRDSGLKRYRNGFFAALLVLMVLSVILAGIWVGIRFRSRSASAVTENPQMQLADGDVRIASKFKSPSENEALDLVGEAMRCRNEREVQTRFRLAESTATEVLRFLAEARRGQIGLDRMRWLGSLDMEDMQMEGVFIENPTEGLKTGRMAFLVPDREGVWKVDFEAFARTSTPGWKHLLEGGADRAKVRVLLAGDSYYNGSFADESAWTCFGMSSPEADPLLPEDGRLMYGYCRKNSPQSRAMDRVVSVGNPIMRVTLEVKRSLTDVRHQFEITRVLSEDWVMPDKPFDERFL